MKSLIRAVPFLLAGNLWAAHGIVQTTDGKTFEGDIRVEEGAFVVGDTNAAEKVELQKLALMRIQPPTQPLVTSLNQTQGLRGTYFTNENFTGSSITRIDPAIDFDWREDAPTNGIGRDHFSVRWEGQIKAPASETFTFITQVDDGVRLWVNKQLLIDKWQPPAPGESMGTIDLEAGRKYNLSMQYFDKEGPALAKLFWSSPSTPRSLIPADHLYPAPAPTNAVTTNAAAASPRNGLLGLYFNESDLSGEFKVRYDPTVDFDSSEGAPVQGINANKFSVRWTGKLVPQFSQHYTFHTLTDDGIRLWLDNKLIMDAWREETMNQTSVPIVLEAGVKYDLRVEAFHIGARWMARLSWSSPSTPLGIIPSSQLFPAAGPDASALAAAKQKTPMGVVLAGGSVIARKIHSADDTAIRFSESTKGPVLSTINVARLILQPLSAETEAKLQPGRAGLLLNSKDFIDGEFRGLANGRVKFSSVLFGIKTYELNQVLAVVLRDIKPALARFEVRTRDQSLLLANNVRLEKGYVAFQDPLLADLKVPASDLLEFKSRP